MVTAIQIANSSDELVMFFNEAVMKQQTWAHLKKGANVRNWLDRFAPEFVKFQVQVLFRASQNA